MSIGGQLGTLARKVNHRFGLIQWLSGDPIPPAGGFDLDGEKLIDWAWICTNLPRGRRKALEIGPGKSPIIPAMLSLGYEVTAIDASVNASKIICGFEFIYGDFQSAPIESKFDVIILCSVVEHIGLPGRYNSREDPDGDLKAMQKVRSLLATDGQVFLTIPVGMDVVHKPWHRVYGERRLPKLLDGFDVIQSRYLIKQHWGPWQETSREKALQLPIDIARYCLGEMALQEKHDGGLA